MMTYNPNMFGGKKKKKTSLGQTLSTHDIYPEVQENKHTSVWSGKFRKPKSLTQIDVILLIFNSLEKSPTFTL